MLDEDTSSRTLSAESGREHGTRRDRQEKGPQNGVPARTLSCVFARLALYFALMFEQVSPRFTRTVVFTAALVIASAGSGLVAQQPAAPQAPATPRAAAPHDLTGYWVSFITEDWRWRMVTPPKGDFISIPLSDEGRKVAFQWDPATDGSCKAFGAAGLMRMPTRLHITWQGDDVLKVESDAGQQTRLLQFGAKGPAGPRSLQGFSVAEWEPLGGPGVGRGPGGALPPRALKVVTTNLAEGWLRRNGVAYSDQTTLTEYWDRVAFPNGDAWLIVSQYVNDPKYLTGEYTTSMHFKREPDASKWKPSPCKTF
jgi:hypothetical protein